MTRQRTGGISVAALLFLLVLYVFSPPLVYMATSEKHFEFLAETFYRPLRWGLEVTRTERHFETYCSWVLGRNRHRARPAPARTYYVPASPRPQRAPVPAPAK